MILKHNKAKILILFFQTEVKVTLELYVKLDEVAQHIHPKRRLLSIGTRVIGKNFRMIKLDKKNNNGHIEEVGGVAI